MNKRITTSRYSDCLPSRGLSTVSVLFLAAITAPPASAMGIDVGDPAWSVRWDNTLRYNMGWRAENVNPAFSHSSSFDETERKFKKGDMVLDRVDILSELDAVYNGRHGARVSAAGWYDNAYHSDKVEHDPAYPSSYDNDTYSNYTRRFHEGPSGEILDAFVFTGFDIGDTSIDMRLGKHTIYWGESLFNSSHAIAYAQSPLDGLKAASSPGITAKETFLPVNQLSWQIQPTPELAIAAQYYLGWKPNRLPEGGTYFGSSDILFDGPDRMFLGYAGDGSPIFADHTKSYKPKDGPGNNFGLSVRWSPTWLDGTLGVYYRKLDETQPWAPILTVDPVTGARGYHLSYAQDTQLVGLSLAKEVFGISLGSELSYRHNTALNSTTSFAATGDIDGREGARGDTLHFLLNGIYLLPRTPLWVGGTLQAELVYSHLMDVTKNKQLFKHEDYAGCPTGQNRDDGCATDDYASVQFGFNPEWPQVLPGGGNLSAPMSLSYGLHGNAATLGGGNEGAVVWSVGLQASFRAKYIVSLKYNDQHASYNTANGIVSTSNGNAVQNDHGWVSLALQTTF